MNHRQQAIAHIRSPLDSPLSASSSAIFDPVS